MVGTHGPKLIANNRAAAFFGRCVHEGLLELALVAPDFTYRLFDVAERQKLTIRVPLNYEEGCSIEPYHEGHWYARRSDLEKLTTIPVTPVARAEAELVPAKTPPAEPASVPPVESPRAEPVPLPESAPAPDMGDLAEVVTTAIEPAAIEEDGALPVSEAARRKRGRPTRVTLELEFYIFNLLDHHGLPDPNDPDWSSQAVIEGIIQDRAGLEKTQAREHASRLINTWLAGKAGKAGKAT